MHQVDGAGIRRIAEGQVDAADRGEDFGEHAMPARIAGDVVEQDRRVTGLALIEIDDAADFLLAVGARDMLDLARGFHFGDPASEILSAQRVLLDTVRNLTVVTADRISDRLKTIGA